MIAKYIQFESQFEAQIFFFLGLSVSSGEKVALMERGKEGTTFYFTLGFWLYSIFRDLARYLNQHLDNALL